MKKLAAACDAAAARSAGSGLRSSSPSTDTVRSANTGWRASQASAAATSTAAASAYTA